MKESKVRDLLEKSKESFSEDWNGEHRLWNKIEIEMNQDRRPSYLASFAKPAFSTLGVLLLVFVSWNIYFSHINSLEPMDELTMSDMENIYFGYEESVFLEDSFASNNNNETWDDELYSDPGHLDVSL